MRVEYIYMCVCVCVRVCVLFDELPDGFLKGRFVKEEPQRLFRSFCLTTAF